MTAKVANHCKAVNRNAPRSSARQQRKSPEKLSFSGGVLRGSAPEHDPRTEAFMDKYLIINADDFGMCHAHNVATFDLLQKGAFTSATNMAPCPWAFEAVRFA